MLPAVPLLLPGRVGAGVGDLLTETHVLRLDGSQVLGLRVLWPAVGRGGRGGPVLDTDTDHPGVGGVVTHGHFLLGLDGYQGGRGRGDSSRVTAGQRVRSDERDLTGGDNYLGLHCSLGNIN